MEHQIKRRPRPNIRTAEGFTAAVKQAERLLFSVSYAILRNSDACADAVQNALLKAWEKRATLNDAALFQSWLVRIVQNESKNLLRQKPNLPLDGDIPCAETSSAGTDVRRAVMHLSGKLRPIAMLYYFEGYSANEVSALLGLPRGTVHSRLSRAREQLRKELTAYEG